MEKKWRKEMSGVEKTEIKGEEGGFVELYIDINVSSLIPFLVHVYSRMHSPVSL